MQLSLWDFYAHPVFKAYSPGGADVAVRKYWHELCLADGNVHSAGSANMF